MSISILYRILCALGATLIVVFAVVSPSQVSQISNFAFAGSDFAQRNTSTDRYVASSFFAVDCVVGAEMQRDLANDLGQASLLLSVVFLLLAVLLGCTFPRISLYKQMRAIFVNGLLTVGQTTST